MAAAVAAVVARWGGRRHGGRGDRAAPRSEWAAARGGWAPAHVGRGRAPPRVDGLRRAAAPGLPWAPPLAGDPPLGAGRFVVQGRAGEVFPDVLAPDPVGRTKQIDGVGAPRWMSLPGPCLPIGPCSPTLPRSANSRSRPEAAAPRHIRGDPRAGSVRAERPSAGHRCPVLSLMVALRGEVRALGSADLPPFSTVPRSRRLGNHSRPPDAPELRASEQGP